MSLNRLLTVSFAAGVCLSATQTTHAQSALSLLNNDSAFKAEAPNSGRLWGYAFGDFYYKSHSDALSRGGSNQYSGIPQSRTAFQFRRIYLGYDYNISKKFAAELLLAAEDNFPAGNPPNSTAPSGDQTLNNKLTYYIKLMNLRWKNVWRGTDLVVGQVSTPSFPLLSEKIWNYRAIERTVADIRRTPSYDLGVTLQGTFDPDTKNYGYDVMMGNGSSAKPESDNFKWFYGDVWAKFMDQKIVVDLYADYERLNWVQSWHHSRQMIKGFVAYTTPQLTVGVEGFITNLKNDCMAQQINADTGIHKFDTLSTMSKAISLYVHGDIIKNKLRFLARLDMYSPLNKVDDSKYNKYVLNTGNYNDNSYNGSTATGDETYKQTFVTAGLDYTPIKNVHFMPNIWYEHYSSQLGNATGSAKGDHDLVYRMTFYFTFGK
jgi:hypothetical protein